MQKSSPTLKFLGQRVLILDLPSEKLVFSVPDLPFSRVSIIYMFAVCQGRL